MTAVSARPRADDVDERLASLRDPLTATGSLGGPSPRRSEVGYSAPGLVPGQEHAVGKRPGLHQVQVHPVVQGREKRRAAAHQDRVGDDRVLVDQPGPHGRRGEGGATDVHGTAILSLEPGDLGDRVWATADAV